MAFRLYVGNYPFDFTRKDVQNLFHDFDGIEFDRIIHSKEKGKSFSFLKCRDIDQLVSVIKKLNGTKVSGRTLIVRASDQSLQEYVTLILQNDESTPSPEEVSFVPMQVTRNKHRNFNRRDGSEKSDMCNKSDTSSVYSEKISPKIEKKAEVFENNSEKCFNQKNEKSDYDKFKPSSSTSSRCSQNSHEMFEKNSTYSSGRDDFARSGMHNKANGIQHKNTYPKDEHNAKVNEDKSQNCYQQRNVKRDSDQFKTSNYSSGRDDFVRPGMHNKSYNNSIQSGNVYSESEYNVGVFEKSPHKPYHQKSVMSDYNQFKAGSSNSPRYAQNSQEMYETNSTHSSSSPSRGFVNHYKYPSNIDSEVSKAKNFGHWHDYRDSSSHTPTWVSVSNFRLGTGIETFYDLFYDYNPLKVIIICNTPRRDKALTEAHICFPNRDIADDVILNFDNTMLEGRVILVNDVEDSTIMDELLDLSNS